MAVRSPDSEPLGGCQGPAKGRAQGPNVGSVSALGGGAGASAKRTQSLWPEVSREIQIVFYGHAVTPEEAAQHVVDEQRFAYPLYVVFLMAPTIYTDFVK